MNKQKKSIDIFFERKKHKYLYCSVYQLFLFVADMHEKSKLIEN